MQFQTRFVKQYRGPALDASGIVITTYDRQEAIAYKTIKIPNFPFNHMMLNESIYTLLYDTVDKKTLHYLQLPVQVIFMSHS